MEVNQERQAIQDQLGLNAYVLFQFYRKWLTTHRGIAKDIEAAEHLGWNKCKVKRWRDRLTKNNPDYYHKVIVDAD